MESIVLFFLAFLTCFLLLQWPVIFLCFRCCPSVCWSVTRTCMCFRCCLSVCWSVTRTCIMYVFQMLSQCLFGVSQEHVYVSDAVLVFVGVSQEHVSCMCFRCCLSVCWSVTRTCIMYVFQMLSQCLLECHKNMYVFQMLSQCLLECHKNMYHVCVSDAVSVFVGVSQEQCRSWKASGSEGVCVRSKSPGKWWCNCPGCCFQGMLG